MTTESRKDPRKQFVPRFLPWILAVVMLGVYCLSLQRWVSDYNVDYVTKVAGWQWRPEAVFPLQFLITYPFRWLPASQAPFALNLLAAILGSATLGLLARSVILLPQDRTEAQRLRETSDFSFLTTGLSWLPPLLAVIVCGLQFTFWLHSTNFTGEMVDIFVFAFTIWSLLEYRLDEREGRLKLALFVFGADMASDAAMIGYLPLLVGALIWIRGLAFFNARFLFQCFFFGLAGTLFYLLLPTYNVVHGTIPGNFWWEALKFNWVSQWQIIRPFFLISDFRHTLGLISLTTLLPVVMLSFRWGAGFGDRSKLGMELTALMINGVFAAILLICLWTAFDPPFSARYIGAGTPGATFLTGYYLAALSAGYYSGYFLLISRNLIVKTSRRRPSALKQMMHPVAVTMIVLLTILTTAGLVYKNGSIIASINSDMPKKYAETVAASLPPTGGILLSDTEGADSDAPRRLLFVQAALTEAGRGKEYVPVDTFALKIPDYHRYLHREYPDRWPLLVPAGMTSEINPHALLDLIVMLSQTNSIYYLEPSFGYYFERFYLEPHGLMYKLRVLPNATYLPKLDRQLEAENEAFWAGIKPDVFDPIVKAVVPVNPFAGAHTFGEQVMARLHVKPEPNINAHTVGGYYSRALNYWGVQLQRGGELKQAAAHFDMAEQLNPDNFAAGVNLGFNGDLQAGKPAVVDLSKTASDLLGKYHSWDAIATLDGPFDEPSFCFKGGSLDLQGGLLHQAIVSFSRVNELVPDYLPAMISLGELYVFTHRADLALGVLKAPLEHPARFGLTDTNSTELNITAAAAYIQSTNLTRGVRLLEKEVALHPENNDLLYAVAQLYFSQNLFSNALQVVQIRLKTAPQDPGWLYQLGEAQMALNHYDQAIAALTKVLSLQPGNNYALFKRALAFLNTGKLNAARTDYLQLQKSNPSFYPVAYGLGEIAWRQHQTNDAIQSYSVYLANAPTNTDEFKMIQQRVAGLKGTAH